VLAINITKTGMQRHINTDDRSIIAGMLNAGYKQIDIAHVLGFTKGAVSKEIQRNKDHDGIYRVHGAKRRARIRRKQSKVSYRLIENNVELENRIKKMLHPLVSPEVVAHELGIHHQTIYSYIYRSNSELKKKLPYQGKKRRKYGSKRGQKIGWTTKVKTFRDNPDDVYFEGDTIKGETRSRVLTHVENQSLYLRADLIPDGTADSVHAILKKKPIKSNIIYDRGSEFALWEMIERDLGIEVFFADPHSPWQRPKNENTNGRLRRLFPKKFNFDTITDRQLQKIVQMMNNTPRKSLNWRTPADVHESLHSD
jgi:IS30 family transposase